MAEAALMGRGKPTATAQPTLDWLSAPLYPESGAGAQVEGLIHRL